MVVNLLKGIEKVSILGEGLSNLEDTTSTASSNALVLIPDSTDLHPSFTIAHSSLKDSNELTVRYAQIYSSLKKGTYPTTFLTIV